MAVIKIAGAAGLLLGLLWPTGAVAHSGGLDSSGCHHDRKRGGYHCHSASSRPATPRPQRPATSSSLYDSLTPAQRRERTANAAEVARNRAVTVASAAPPSPVYNFGIGMPLMGVATVTDGDSLIVGGRRIRLYGIDAFEAAQRCGAKSEIACGAKATETLRTIVGVAPIVCVEKGLDRYERTLAVCRIGINDINAAMVRSGWAMAYRKYANDYSNDEDIANGGRAGAWESGFQWPWEYRADGGDHVAIAQRFDPGAVDGCVIKGNVSSKGDKIYHFPADASYRDTKAEALFCSEAAAINAGFRRPRG